MNINVNELKKVLLQSDFESAEKILSSFSTKEYTDTILEVAFDTKSILIYTFMIYKLLKKENASTHFLVSHILFLPLCHLEGAYRSALFHARRAVELDPKKINYKEYLLFFHAIPEQLISKDEAIKIAYMILKERSDSLIAKDLLQAYEKPVS